MDSTNSLRYGQNDSEKNIIFLAEGYREPFTPPNENNTQFSQAFVRVFAVVPASPCLSLAASRNTKTTTTRGLYLESISDVEGDDRFAR